MNELYPILLIIVCTVGLMSLVFVIRWINDANCTGWRLRQWREYANSGNGRPWSPWFAWRPVRTVSGERVWLKWVYRRVGNTLVDYDDWLWYHYGTVMDVLKDTR